MKHSLKPKIGDRVKVIYGGIGARCADGAIGIVIEKPFRRPTDYGGEIWEDAAELYIKEDIHGIVFGLCSGYEIEFISPSNLTKDIPNPARDEYFEQLYTLIIHFIDIDIEDGEQEKRTKERILSITYDKVVELQNRIEELETKT